MGNLTNDQIQWLLTLFRAQNADRNITDFIPGFRSCECGFSKYKNIGDLVLVRTALLAVDDGFGDKWGIVKWYCRQFNVARVGEDFRFEKDEPFDIMEHISFEDKL